MKKPLLTFLCACFLMAGPAQVVITEIMYNNPGTDDYEFLELYNNGGTAVDMTGWSFSQGVTYTFPNYTLNAGDYVLISIDSVLFEAAFGVPTFQFTGALSNGGEVVQLVDANGTLVDSVQYDDANPWVSSPDGSGPSLILCNVDGDNNDPNNWAAAVTGTGFEINGQEIFANPGSASNCPTGAIIGFIDNQQTVNEAGGSIQVGIALSLGDANDTELTLDLVFGSTATAGMDFSLTLPMTITFPGGNAVDTQWVNIPIVDDIAMEAPEVAIFEIKDPTNGGNITPGESTFSLNIVDNDTPLSGSLVISGIFDAQPANAGTKGIELKAIQDIVDLSLFGVGSANNGQGSDGEELSFPNISVTAGTCIYIADDSTKFFDFFGFFPDFVSGAANINGDDAIELFENGQVIDLFGDIDVDGSGEPWEYLDGWAYRASGTGPDGAIFELDNWTFSGVDALDGFPTNAAADAPFPVCTYSEVPPTTVIANDDFVETEQNIPIVIDVLGNDVQPNTVNLLAIIGFPTNGTASINGIVNVNYEPNMDFCGNTDSFIYRVCDSNGCDTATVTVNVLCPTDYPAYDIGTVTTQDANMEPDSADITCQLQGIVHGIDTQGGPDPGVSFALIDATGGITVFNNDENFSYEVNEGDEVIVRGTISAFACLTEIVPDTIILVSTNNTLVTPTVITELDEDDESELIRINNLTVQNIVVTGTSGINVTVNNGSQDYILRIDNDAMVDTLDLMGVTFHAIGLGGQFDNDGTCDGGYQFAPRYAADILFGDATIDRSLAQQIQVFPNPVRDQIFIETLLNLDEIVITNILGKKLLSTTKPSQKIDVSGLSNGIYIISFRTADRIWATQFVKS